MARHPPPPSECAQCGAEIPPNARACPECGADERTGWREASIYDGLDLPDPDFESKEFHAESSSGERRVNGIAWYWWCVGVALLLLLGLTFLGLR